MKTDAGVEKARGNWLPNMDSNHDRLLQRQSCYHYTIRQTELCKTKAFIGLVKHRLNTN